MENSKKMSGGGYGLDLDFLPCDLKIPDDDIKNVINSIDADIKQVTKTVENWLEQIVDDE